MRRHQPHEADRADHRGGRSHRQGRPSERQHADAGEIDAEALRLGFPQAQRVQGAGGQGEQAAADQDEGRGERHVGPAAVRQRAQQPLGDLIDGEQAGGEVQRQGHARAGQAGHRGPGEDQGQGSPAAGDGEGGAGGDQGARHRQERGGQGEGAAEAEIDRDHRPERRPAGDPEQPRFGQRVAGQPLEGRARQAQRRPHQHGQDGARRAHLQHHQAGHAPVRVDQGASHGGGIEGHATGQQRGERGCGQPGEAEGQEGRDRLHRGGPGIVASAWRKATAASAVSGTPQP